MQQFKIRKDGFKELRKRLLLITIPIYLIIILVVTIAPVLKSGADKEDINSLPFTLVIIIIIFIFLVYRLINKQKKALESYTLIIEKNLIAREMMNAKPTSIYFNEISSISKTKRGSLIVRGKTPQDIIIILSQIENYDEIENTLKQIRPFDEKPTLTFFQRNPVIVSLLMVVLFLIFFISDNKIIAGISGSVMSLILLWGFYKIRINKTATYKAKQNSWWILFIAIGIIATMIMKILGKY